jgi:hypothetical protein
MPRQKVREVARMLKAGGPPKKRQNGPWTS